MSDPGTAVILPSEGSVSLGVIHGTLPDELLNRATGVANSLARLIEEKKLYSPIQGKRYVRVEGWLALAVMLGCVPREASVTRREDGTYEALVELVRMSDGAVLTRASAECGMDEKKWASGPDYARRSMAATRATSKACRLAFSWVMVLAGFEATPSEEMLGVVESRKAESSGTTMTPLPAGTLLPVSAPAPLSEMPAALHEDDFGPVLKEPVLGELLKDIAAAGIVKEGFAKWYRQTMNRPYDLYIYEGDVPALRAEAAKLRAQKGRKSA